jgi:hypothetical protein
MVDTCACTEWKHARMEAEKLFYRPKNCGVFIGHGDRSELEHHIFNNIGPHCQDGAVPLVYGSLWRSLQSDGANGQPHCHSNETC